MKKPAILVLPLFVLLTACGTVKEALTEYRLVYPTVPEHLLLCEAEPGVPNGLNTDVQLVKYLDEVRASGEDCRAKLRALKGITRSWNPDLKDAPRDKDE